MLAVGAVCGVAFDYRARVKQLHAAFAVQVHVGVVVDALQSVVGRFLFVGGRNERSQFVAEVVAAQIGVKPVVVVARVLCVIRFGVLCLRNFAAADKAANGQHKGYRKHDNQRPRQQSTVSSRVYHFVTSIRDFF